MIFFCNRKAIFRTRFYASLAFNELGIEIEWIGENEKECGINKQTGKIIVEVDP